MEAVLFVAVTARLAERRKNRPEFRNVDKSQCVKRLDRHGNLPPIGAFPLFYEALPTRAETGLPPKVLKYSIPLAKVSAISALVTSAARG